MTMFVNLSIDFRDSPGTCFCHLPRLRGDICLGRSLRFLFRSKGSGGWSCFHNLCFWGLFGVRVFFVLSDLGDLGMARGYLLELIGSIWLSPGGRNRSLFRILLQRGDDGSDNRGALGVRGSREGFVIFLGVSEEAHKSIPDGTIASKMMVPLYESDTSQTRNNK